MESSSETVANRPMKSVALPVAISSPQPSAFQIPTARLIPSTNITDTTSFNRSAVDFPFVTCDNCYLRKRECHLEKYGKYCATVIKSAENAI